MLILVTFILDEYWSCTRRNIETISEHMATDNSHLIYLIPGLINLITICQANMLASIYGLKSDWIYQ